MIENDKKLNKDSAWWRPVMIFYAKTTSWVIFPLVLAVLFGRYVGESMGSQTLFLIFIMVGFDITCFGIYREIKDYKKQLEENDKDGNK